MVSMQFMPNLALFDLSVMMVLIVWAAPLEKILSKLTTMNRISLLKSV